ncbi:hypothetical protein HAX54_038447, partial [Datura stramonium]|nr:hypothetical protein [Datura stramonium]
ESQFLAVLGALRVSPTTIGSPVPHRLCHYTEEAVPRACQRTGEGPRRAFPCAGIIPCRACQRVGELGASRLAMRHCCCASHVL